MRLEITVKRDSYLTYLLPLLPVSQTYLDQRWGQATDHNSIRSAVVIE